MNGENWEERLERIRSLRDARRQPDCPPESRILELARGALPGEQIDPLLEHVSGCGYCSGLLSEHLEDDPSGIEPPAQNPLRAPRPGWSWVAAAAIVLLTAGAAAIFHQVSNPEPAPLLARAFIASRPSEIRIPEAEGPAPVRARLRSAPSVFDRPLSFIEAENEIVKQAERHPDDPRWIRARALSLIFQVNLAAAESLLRRAQQVDPQGSFDLEYGLIAFERADYKLAVERFTRALERDPASASALYNRAVAYRRDGLIALARADFERLLAAERDPRWISEIQRLMRTE